MRKIESILKNKNYFQTYKSVYISYIAEKVLKKYSFNFKTIVYKRNIIKIQVINPYEIGKIKKQKEVLIKEINSELKANLVTNLLAMRAF